MSATEQDRADFERMLADVEQMLADDVEIGRLVREVQQRHLMDTSAPVMAAVTRLNTLLSLLDGYLGQVRLELRLIQHYLGSTR